MNWHKMPPSERYKVLEEEKKKQYAEKAELERTDTLSLRYIEDYTKRYLNIFIN